MVQPSREWIIAVVVIVVIIAVLLILYLTRGRGNGPGPGGIATTPIYPSRIQVGNACLAINRQGVGPIVGKDCNSLTIVNSDTIPDDGIWQYNPATRFLMTRWPLPNGGSGCMVVDPNDGSIHFSTGQDLCRPGQEWQIMSNGRIQKEGDGRCLVVAQGQVTLAPCSEGTQFTFPAYQGTS